MSQSNAILTQQTKPKVVR